MVPRFFEALTSLLRAGYNAGKPLRQLDVVMTYSSGELKLEDEQLAQLRDLVPIFVTA
jgi:hypothetical protein